MEDQYGMVVERMDLWEMWCETCMERLENYIPSKELVEAEYYLHLWSKEHREASYLLASSSVPSQETEPRSQA